MERLSCHPASPASPASSALTVAAAARRLATGAVEFRYRVAGDVRAIRVGAPATPERTDELWRHTCFEAFLKSPGSERYLELNFSPSTEWAAYEFARYRERLEPPPLDAPAICFTAGDAWLELEATVRLPTSGYAGRDSALGLAAVIEDSAGRLSYWALEHPRARPDFHDAAAWKSRVAAST